MGELKRTIEIIIAEDDDDDYSIAKEAFEEASVINPLKRVTNGEELIDLLNSRKSSMTPGSLPLLILLDLSMPKKNGFEALEEIKADEDLKSIPIIILTTSDAEEDIVRSYKMGVNSFIRKPVRFSEFVAIINIFNKYWLEIVELPDSISASKVTM